MVYSLIAYMYTHLINILLLCCKVVWTRLYKTSSSQEGGTLYQLRNLINRRNVICDPKKDMNSCEDFFELVTKAHNNYSRCYEGIQNEKNWWQTKWRIISTRLGKPNGTSRCSEKIVSQFMHLSFPVKIKKRPKSMDHVLEYGKDILTMGLLLLEFKDTIKHGAGFRILRCWKFVSFFFEQQVIQIIHWNHSTYCAIITTYCHLDMQSNWYGAVLWTLMALVVEIYPLIFTWNI